MKKDILNFSLKDFNKSTFFEFSILLFAFTLPLWRNVNTIILFPLIVSWIVHSSFQNKIENLRRNKISFYVLILLYLLYWISLFFSDNYKENFRDIERTSTLFLLPLIVLSSNRLHFNLKKILIALGIGLFIGIVVCWSYVIIDILSKSKPLEQAKYFFQWIYSDWKLLAPLGMHPSYFAVMLVLFITTISFEPAFAKVRKMPTLFCLILLISLLFLMETSSRIAFISTFIIFLINIFKISDLKRKTIYMFIALTLILISFQFDYLTTKFDKIFDAGGNFSFERIHRWKHILKVFFESENFIFGVGAGDVNLVYTKAYVDGGFELALKENYNAHNQYLEFLVSNGLIGLLIYFLVLAYFALKTNLRSSYFLNFFVIVLIFSITESIFCTSKGVFFFSFFYSVLIVQSKEINNVLE